MQILVERVRARRPSKVINRTVGQGGCRGGRDKRPASPRANKEWTQEEPVIHRIPCDSTILGRYTKRMMNSCCVRATHPMNVVHAAVDFPERLTIVGLDVKGSLGTLARGPDSIQLIVTLA